MRSRHGDPYPRSQDPRPEQGHPSLDGGGHLHRQVAAFLFYGGNRLNHPGHIRTSFHVPAHWEPREALGTEASRIAR